MNHKHTRQLAPPRQEPLRTEPPRPCMRGRLDIELYNRTKEITYIEPLTEYVSPINPMDAPPINPEVKRKGTKFTMNHNKPESAVLEVDLRAGQTIPEIAKKYNASVATVNNWIRAYGLKGIKGKPKEDEVIQPSDMVQESPTLNEIEQFHTDEPVQELPKVEIDRVLVPGCYGEYNLDKYWCNDCEVKAECLTTFNKLTTNKREQANEPVMTIESYTHNEHKTETLGMTEEENMTDAEWEAEGISFVDVTPDQPATRETFDEIWSDVRDDLKTLERLYIAEAKVRAEFEAKKSFRERLRDMLADVVGELGAKEVGG